MLKHRLLWGTIIITFITGLLWFDHIRQDNTGFTLLFLLVVLFGLYEFYQMFTNIDLVISKAFPLVMIALLIIGYWIKDHLYPRCFISFSVVFAFFLLGLVIQHLFKAQKETLAKQTNSLFVSIIGIIYIYWCLSFIRGMRMDILLGEQLFIWFVAVNKMADTLAYFGGKLFGRNLLAPAISPRKTIAGFLWALIGGTSFGIFLWYLMGFSIHLGWLAMVSIGLACTLSGQLGDLLESLIKRYCQVKDSSTIFPGLGGVLDMIDSLILSAPITYYLFKMHLYGHPL